MLVNMCNSFINAANLLNFELAISSPAGYEPAAELIKANSQHAHLEADPIKAVKDSDLVVTDVWASMGQESEQNERAKAFGPYQVSPELMSHAHSDALFMHCLPAHRDDEATSEVMDGPNSVIFDEAENRLHAQKAIMRWCLGV